MITYNLDYREVVVVIVVVVIVVVVVVVVVDVVIDVVESLYTDFVLLQNTDSISISNIITNAVLDLRIDVARSGTRAPLKLRFLR